ncbi:MAG: peptidoglycan DD-metalloendopeptidase family protein [Candidatus Omnitrophota bacterium]
MRNLNRILSFLLCFCFLFGQSGFAQVAGQLDASGSIFAFHNSSIPDKFRALHLRSLGYNNNLNNFRLLLDKGDLKDVQKNEIEKTIKTLLNYFFIGLTLPNDAFWVNLRPDSENSIIDSDLAKTDVGKILLEADLQLKKDTAKFTSPDTVEGKAYWEKLYKKAGELLGAENIAIPTLTRPWIVPGEIIICETRDNAYVYKATLKVMLEQDYLKGSANYSFNDPRLKILNEYSSQLVREMIVPKLNKEINTSKRYAPLRQVYYSLILAQWFKARFYGKAGKYYEFINKKDLQGLISKTSWSKTAYFMAYQKSFKDGEYNIQQPVYTPYGQSVRSYFSGGFVCNIAMPRVPELGVAETTKNGATEVTAILGDVEYSPEAHGIVGALATGDSSEIEVTVIEKASSPLGLLSGSRQLGASSVELEENSLMPDTLRSAFDKAGLTYLEPENLEEYFKFIEKFGSAFGKVKTKEEKEKLAWLSVGMQWFGTNERDWASTLGSMTNKKGVYLGVGYSGVNLSRLCHGDFNRAIILDANPYVTEIFMPIRAALISMSQSRAEYLGLLAGIKFNSQELEFLKEVTLAQLYQALRKKIEETDEAARKGLKELIWNNIEKQFPPEAKEAARDFWSKYSGRNFGLKGMVEAMVVPGEIKIEDSLRGKESWLANENNFNKIKTMTQEGRILGVSGSLLDSQKMDQIALYLEEKGLMASVIYISNIPEWLSKGAPEEKKRDFGVLQKNIEHLPKRNAVLLVHSYRSGSTIEEIPDRENSPVALETIKAVLPISTSDLPDFKAFVFRKGAGFGSNWHWGNQDQASVIHNGVDIFEYERNDGKVTPIPKNTLIHSITSGRVLTGSQGNEDIIVLTDDNMLIRYGHIISKVTIGDRVEAGQVIGEFKLSSRMDGVLPIHLHLQVLVDIEEDNELVNAVAQHFKLVEGIDSVEMRGVMNWNSGSRIYALIDRKTNDIGVDPLKLWPQLFKGAVLYPDDTVVPLGRKYLDKEDGAIENSVSPFNPGGVDFRVMPAIVQPLGTLEVNLNPVEISRLNSIDLDLEWFQIQKMLNGGIIPSPERIKDYILAYSQKRNLARGMNSLLGCIADIMRIEEDRVLGTELELREMLVSLQGR